MAFLIPLLMALAAFSLPASAKDDPMEAQRCIWRCLENSKGANDPAYGAGVAKYCNGDSSKPEADQPSASGVWTYGTHPKLGLSAHVSIGEEAFGISCDTPPGTGYVAALRMTLGLVPNAT
jgi:hypothetical protein